jgi:hypothetical protein
VTGTRLPGAPARNSKSPKSVGFCRAVSSGPLHSHHSRRPEKRTVGRRASNHGFKDFEEVR